MNKSINTTEFLFNFLYNPKSHFVWLYWLFIKCIFSYVTQKSIAAVLDHTIYGGWGPYTTTLYAVMHYKELHYNKGALSCGLHE